MTTPTIAREDREVAVVIAHGHAWAGKRDNIELANYIASGERQERLDPIEQDELERNTALIAAHREAAVAAAVKAERERIENELLAAQETGQFDKREVYDIMQIINDVQVHQP